MISSKLFICDGCGYSTNRKYNLELHHSSPKACEKRMKRLHKLDMTQNVTEMTQNVTVVTQNVTEMTQNVTVATQNVTVNNRFKFDCQKCNKNFKRNWNYERHLKTCNGLKTLQCPKCKKHFNNRQNKNDHVKNVKCEMVLTDEQQRIKELEDESRELKHQLEEEKQKRKEAEESKSTVNNYITNNNYFDNSINYNNYDQLSMEHITEDDIKRLFDNCKMQYPELSEDLTRLILSLKENQSIYLPEGQKSNTCTVMKDGLEIRKPLIRVLMNLGMQTAMFIRNSNVIERDRKSYVNNQFWADNRNACGLHISGVDEMTDSDKEIVQRNKNVVLDMCEGRV